MDEAREPEALGWNAIHEALSGIYGDVEPKHWGTVLPYALGGNDPLTGLSAFQDPTNLECWHFVTYGFSELYEKESDDIAVSGFGFELTFRLVTSNVEEQATWVFNFLQNLARYVFDTGRVFGRGHTMPLNGPICAESDTDIQCVAFVLDPELGEIQTPNGSVEFLQIVGLTTDEISAIQYWNARSFLDLVAVENPKLVTDLDRASFLSNGPFAETVAKRSAEEGASCGEFYTNSFSFSSTRFTRKCTLKIGAYFVEDLTRRICGRIPYDRDFLLTGEPGAVIFSASKSNGWSVEGDTLTLELTADTARSMQQSLLPKAGTYKIPGLDKLAIEVEQSEIKDNDGNVTEIVG